MGNRSIYRACSHGNYTCDAAPCHRCVWPEIRWALDEALRAINACEFAPIAETVAAA